MAESSDSVSIDIDMVPLGEKVKQPPQPNQKKKIWRTHQESFIFYFCFCFIQMQDYIFIFSF